MRTPTNRERALAIFALIDGTINYNTDMIEMMEFYLNDLDHVSVDRPYLLQQAIEVLESLDNDDQH